MRERWLLFVGEWSTEEASSGSITWWIDTAGGQGKVETKTGQDLLSTVRLLSSDSATCIARISTLPSCLIRLPSHCPWHVIQPQAQRLPIHNLDCIPHPRCKGPTSEARSLESFSQLAALLLTNDYKEPRHAGKTPPSSKRHLTKTVSRLITLRLEASQGKRRGYFASRKGTVVFPTLSK